MVMCATVAHKNYNWSVDGWFSGQVITSMLTLNEDLLTYLTSWNYETVYWCCRCDAVSQSAHKKEDCHVWREPLIDYDTGRYYEPFIENPVILRSTMHSWVNLSDLDSDDLLTLVTDLKARYGDDFPFFPLKVTWPQ
jgi:hypothetical protein